MQHLSEQAAISVQSDQDSIGRLLAALGDWGEAEERGESASTLEQLHLRARDAYLNFAAVA